MSLMKNKNSSLWLKNTYYNTILYSTFTYYHIIVLNKVDFKSFYSNNLIIQTELNSK